MKRIRREDFTGGRYREAQVQCADGMVALGGGKGTYACGKDMSDLGKPVLPMDLDIGAFSEDGKGALDLHREFVDSPGRFFPKTHATVAGRIESCRSTASELNLQYCSESGRNTSTRVGKRYAAWTGVDTENGPGAMEVGPGIR